MKKNRNIKKLIKKRIEIGNSENKTVSNTNKNPRLISTPSIKPKRTVKIIDQNAKQNKGVPKNLNKFEKRLYDRTGTVGNVFRDPYVKAKDVKYDIVVVISSFSSDTS